MQAATLTSANAPLDVGQRFLSPKPHNSSAQLPTLVQRVKEGEPLGHRGPVSWWSLSQRKVLRANQSGHVPVNTIIKVFAAGSGLPHASPSAAGAWSTCRSQFRNRAPARPLGAEERGLFTVTRGMGLRWRSGPRADCRLSSAWLCSGMFNAQGRSMRWWAPLGGLRCRDPAGVAWAPKDGQTWVNGQDRGQE